MRASGWILRAQFLFLKQRGKTDFDQVVEKCPARTRAFFEDGFLETRWYPLELLVDICEAAESALGGDGVNICEEMGKFACGMSFNSTHRLLFKFGDVDWLIERASKAWSSHFDAGDLQARRTSGGAVLIELVGVATAPDAACHLIKGWMEKAAEVSGEDAFDCTMEIAPSPDVRARWRFAWPDRPGF